MNLREQMPMNHLDRMTDSTGVVQHAVYSAPRRESGYMTDEQWPGLAPAMNGEDLERRP